MPGPGRPTNDPNDYFAWGKQTVKDTDAATFQYPKHLDGSGFEVDDEVDRIREGGDGQEVGLSYRTMVKADAALNVLSRPATHGRLFAGVLGTDTVGTAAVASVARHTAVPAASLPYFTVEQRSGDVIERTGNSVITSLALEGEAGKPFQLAAQFLGAGTVTFRESALTPSREIGKPFFYPGASYVIDGFASYSTSLTKVRVEVARQVDDGIQTTGLSREDVIPLALDVTVDATVKVTSREFYRKCQFSSGTLVPVDLATGSLDIAQNQQVWISGSQSATGLMRVVCPLLEYTDAKINKLDPDGKTVYLDVTAMSIKGSTHAIYAITDTTDGVVAY